MSLKKLLAKTLHKESKVFLLILRLGGAGLFFLASIFITNRFDIKLVSDFEFFHSTMLLLGSFVLFGTDVSILQIAGDLRGNNRIRELRSLYVKSMQLIGIATACFFVLFGVLCLVVHLGTLELPVSLQLLFKIICCIGFYGVSLLSAEAFRTLHKNLWTELYHGIFRYGLLFVGVFVLYYLDYTTYLVDLYLAGFIFVAVISGAHFLRSTASFDQPTSLSRKDIAKISFPMSLSSLSFFVLLSTDVILLKLLGFEEAVSIYAQPLKVIAIIVRVKVALEASYAVHISETYFSDKLEDLQSIIKKINRTVALFCVPLVLVSFLLAPWILSIFGEEYISGDIAFYILLAGVSINILTGATGIYMNMTKKQVPLQNIMLVTAAANVLLNLVLIPPHGIIGAGIASLASVAIWNIATVVYIYRKDKILILLH